MADKVNITTPVGRIVAGSLYKPNDKNFDGKPLTTQDGKPRVQYFIAVAIPKTPGATHFSQEPWGAKIWQVGHQAFPQAAQRTDFAWKIEDGDSQIPNKRNRKPCEQEGWAGNWIIKFSGGFALKIFRQEGNGWAQMLEPDAVKPGYFVEVNFNVEGNNQQNNSGVYLNPQAVCFRGYGPEIVFGPNVEEMGFGNAPLPAGASLQPQASNAPPPASPVVAPQAPPVPVYPNTGFIQMPAPGAPGASYPPPPVPAYPGAVLPAAGAIPPPPVPAAPSNQPRMSAKAGNVSYTAYRAAGWSDAQLIAEGLMLA